MTTDHLLTQLSWKNIAAESFLEAVWLVWGFFIGGVAGVRCAGQILLEALDCNRW